MKSISLFIPSFKCYTDFLVDAWPKCIPVNADGWRAAYKAHGAIFVVAEVVVTLSHNVTCHEKFIYGASEGVLKWDKGIVS